jgi:hypothetical protein
MRVPGGVPSISAAGSGAITCCASTIEERLSDASATPITTIARPCMVSLMFDLLSEIVVQPISTTLKPAKASWAKHQFRIDLDQQTTNSAGFVFQTLDKP